MKYKKSIIQHRQQSTIEMKCHICNITFNDGHDQFAHSQQHPIDLDDDKNINLNDTTPTNPTPAPEKKLFFGPVKNELASSSTAHKCRTCGRTFRAAKDLEQHQLRHSNKSIKDHVPCNDCGYRFLTKYFWSIHDCHKL